MLIYIITILILFIFASIEENYNINISTKYWMVAISYTIIVFQVGLRWETGTDWIPYSSHFESYDDIRLVLISDFEIGYSFFVWFVQLFTSSYSVFLLIHALIYYFLIFKAFDKFTINIFLALLIFYSFTMGMLGSNRQLIALSICLYALKYVQDKKPIKFFFLIIIAIFFHTSAFLFALYYFINRDIKPITLLLILVGTYVIGKTQLPIIIFNGVGNLFGGYIQSKTMSYSQGAKNAMEEYQLSAFGLVKRLLFVFVFYVNRKHIYEKLSYYKLMLNGYIIGLVLYFLFAESLLVMVSRGSLYFNCMEPLLITAQICLIKKEEKQLAIIILFLLSFLLFYQSIAAYPDLFIPYKGVFINSEYYRIMH